MAHTPRPKNDTRPFSIFLGRGTRIGMMTNKGPMYGIVNYTDEGNWIYPTFTEGSRGVRPGWCRASQVFLDTREKTLPQTLKGK